MYHTNKTNAVLTQECHSPRSLRGIFRILNCCTDSIKVVILNLIQDLPRLLFLLRKGVRGRFQIKFGMTPLFNKGAFTLLELLVVILIIAILAAIALPQYQLAVARANMSQLVVRFNTLEKATQLYFLTYGAFPTDIRNLELDLSAQGAKYARMSTFTSRPDAKGLEYPNGDQCGTWYDPVNRKNIIACTNKDLALSVYYPVGTWLSKPDRRCSAKSEAGEKICKRLSPNQKTTQTYDTGFHQWQL